MAQLHVLRVFTTETGSHGNPLGVFVDGGEVAHDKRQTVARDLGFSETVFVDDAGRGEVAIFTPAVELPFAGHPMVGVAWLLAERSTPPATLRPPAGELRVRVDGDLTWIGARPQWSPPFEYCEYDSPAAVDDLTPAGTLRYAWAWIDESAGTVRARSFVPEVGITEDEATGSAALALASQLDREIAVTQGEGSILRARPLPAGWAEVGGRVKPDEVRGYSVESK